MRYRLFIMPQRTCCVSSCTSSLIEGAVLHAFPNPATETDKFRAWVTNAGLVGEDESYVFKNRRICRIHFEETYHYPKNRLSKLAIPTLHLTGAPIHLPTSTMESDQILSTPRSNISPSTSGASTSTFMPLDNEDEKLITIDQASKKISKCTSGASTSTFRPLDNEDEKLITIDQASKKIPKCRQYKKLSKTEIDLYNTVAKTQNQLKRCQRIKDSLKLKLNIAKKLTKSEAYKTVTQELSPAARTFFEMQIKQASKDPKGRRFTVDEKILALTLYKPSPKAYRILSKICVLPKKSILNKLLTKVSLSPGPNNQIIFDHLKKRVEKMPPAYRFCTIIFDEMAISPKLSFDKFSDEIKGFSDDGEIRRKTFADHVLVFMIRGILKKYKQPISYSFCTATTKTERLKKLLVSIIKNVNATGLKVVSTTCDQGSTNMAAINSLINDTKAEYLREEKHFKGGFFKIDSQEIYPIYDPPHLMKGIRNNLLTKDLEFKIKEKKYTAKWAHLEALYRRGPGFKKMRMIPKLTAQHVIRNKIPKMKVKYCTQVFSRTVSIGMGYTAGTGRIPKEATETAELLLFFDKLFDSLNGSFSKPKNGKIYRSAVTPRSPHHALWRSSLQVLKSMKFVGGRVKVVPSISSFIKTVEAFQQITRKLHALGLKSLLLRNFNQDPLENFFGAIRSHGHSNTMPSASAFESSYKSLLVNNLVSPRSVGTNCESDEGYCLQSLKYFLQKNIVPETEMVTNDINENHFLIPLLCLDRLKKSTDPVDLEHCAAAAYCSGWLIKIIYKTIAKGCGVCHADLEGDSEEEYCKFISFKKYTDQSLLHYPSRSLLECFINIENICNEILKTDCESKNISVYIETILSILLPLDFLNCAVHKDNIKKVILRRSILFFINNWYKDVNYIMCGKSVIVDNNDCIKKLASEYYFKNKKIK